MLNKDQYNQDEYNNYYKQETEGAEIKGYNDDEGGFMKKAILFLGLIALGFAGYFGFKTFNSSSENNNIVTKEKIVIKEETSTSEKAKEKETTPKSETIEEKVLKTIETNKADIGETTNNSEKITKEVETKANDVEEKMEKTIQQEVATQIQEKFEDNKKMSTDDISKIVNLVMNKIEKEKVETPKTNNDTDLLSALQNSDSDSIEIKTKDIEPVKTNVESAVQKDIEKINSNNKVTLDNDSKSNNKEDLTELSQQIKKLLNMAGANNQPSTKPTQTTSKETTKTSVPDSTSTATNYEQSISKEIKVRTNEMRIIVVKSGDTLNKIAQRAYGNASSYQKIFDANPDIRRADRIYVGQKLRIPK